MALCPGEPISELVDEIWLSDTVLGRVGTVKLPEKETNCGVAPMPNDDNVVNSSVKDVENDWEVLEGFSARV